MAKKPPEMEGTLSRFTRCPSVGLSTSRVWVYQQDMRRLVPSKAMPVCTLQWSGFAPLMLRTSVPGGAPPRSYIAPITPGESGMLVALIPSNDGRSGASRSVGKSPDSAVRP